MYRVGLVIAGVDLDDDETVSCLTGSLTDLVWQTSAGRTLAVVFAPVSPVAVAARAARHIALRLPGAKVLGVDEELVSVSDIGSRAGVTREAVRLWVAGDRGPGGFPMPRGAVGGGTRGSSRVWDWGSVNQWLESHYNLGDGYQHLSAEQVVELNAEIHHVTTRLAFEREVMRTLSAVLAQWRELVVPPERLAAGGATTAQWTGGDKRRESRTTHLKIVHKREAV